MWYISTLFFDNFFNPNENNKIQDNAKLNKKTIETLLNELFVLDNQDKNEETIRQYAKDIGLTVTQKQVINTFAKIINGFL